MKGLIVMKSIKKILSCVSAALVGLSCAVTASAYSGNDITYDDGSVIFYDSGTGHATSKRYDFTMNYVLSADETNSALTADYFGLPDNYSVNLADSSDTSITYSVEVETQEELDKLYEASIQLLENGTIVNAFKQFTYEYGCLDQYMAKITLKGNDDNFDLHSVEGLENFEIVQSEREPKTFTVSGYGEEQYRSLKLAESAAAEIENIESFSITMLVCALMHNPETVRTYLVYDGTEEPPADVLPGDANGDGELSVRDCSYIAKMISAGRSGELTQAADYNSDGIVNVRDAASLSQYLSKLYVPFFD
ncbi:MAG: dockerin type I domain-containing protein [Porcipelethomonas sp.]